MKKHSHTADIVNPADVASTEAQPAATAPSPLPEQELAELKTKAAEHWDKLVRVAADFENFKKRAARERQEASKYANESLLQKLIPVLDNFEAALAAAGPGQSNSMASLQAGIAMIHQQLKSALADAGLEEIDATAKPFDPNFHEAVSEESTHDAPEGQVVKQLRRGYKLRDRLLRPATVIVAKRPVQNEI
jgi:molecular chaperone GrpE